MKVFVSWSGSRSKAVAEALRNLLPSVVQLCNLWISSHDIDAGERWGLKLAKELEDTTFGILCLTPENLTAPWLLFEAGALSKIVDGTNVCPLLLGINKQTDITGPLAQFQSVNVDRDGVWDLTKSINHALGDQALDEKTIAKVFSALWSDFETSIKAIPENIQETEGLKRTPEDLLDEVLRTVREQSRMLSDISEAQSRISPGPELKEAFYFKHGRVSPIPAQDNKHSNINSDDVNLVNQVIAKYGPSRFAEIKETTGFSERRLANVISYMVERCMIFKGDDRRYGTR